MGFVVYGLKHAKQLGWSFKTYTTVFIEKIDFAAGERRLLNVCDLCVADGVGLLLSSGHWIKIRHSGKKSDNLGIDTPRFSKRQIASHMVLCRGRLPWLFNRHLFSILLFDPRHSATLFLLCYQTLIWQL